MSKTCFQHDAGHGARHQPLKHGKPEIFNTDQGSQFTGTAFTGVLAAVHAKRGFAPTTSRSAWTAKALGETTSSSNALHSGRQWQKVSRLS